MAFKSQAQRVVDAFGGINKMAEVTVYGPDSIRNWLRAGIIMEKHMLPLLISARAAGIALTPYDFVAHLADALAERIAAEMAAQQTSGTAPASSASPAF